MVEKKAMNGENSLEEGESFEFTSLLPGDPVPPNRIDARELQSTALGKLLDAMPIPALLIDPLLRIAFANRSCKRIFQQPEKLQGLSLSTLFPAEPAVAEIQRLTEEVFATGKCQVVEPELKLTGQRMGCRFYLQSVTFGNNKWMVLLIKDLLPPKKRSLSGKRYRHEFQKEIIDCGSVEKLPVDDRQRLELALKGAGMGVWDVDLQKDKVFFNQTCTDIFGHLLDEIGTSAGVWRNLIHPDDKQRLFRAWNEHLEGPAERFEAEYRIKNKPDEWKWLLARGKVVQRRRDGKPLRISGIIFDITDRKCGYEKMLRAETEALERSNKDLEEFAYLAAHDLREPLIGIAAYARILQSRYRDGLDAQTHQFISRTIDTITRTDRLIQSLLSYSRLDRDARNFEPTDSNVLLTVAIADLRSAIEASGATVTSESLPTVMADPLLLLQVFQNLLSNAIKFAGDEPLQIRVGAQQKEDEWRFFVRDNGIGVQPSDFDRIFRIFQRIDSSPDRLGTGIGLASCKKIVEHHGGRIWVESEPGKGSTFFFTIPHSITLDV